MALPRDPWKLTPKMRQAVNLYLRGWPVQRICDRIGITSRTFYNWRTQHFGFKKEIQDVLKAVEHEAGMNIRQLVKSAIQEIEGLLQDPSPQVRLGAARLSLETYSNMVAAEEQKVVLAELEAQLQEVQQLALAQGGGGPLPPGDPVDVDVVETSREPEAAATETDTGHATGHDPAP